MKSGEPCLRKWCLCQDLQVYRSRQSKREGLAFDVEGTISENALKWGGICNCKTSVAGACWVDITFTWKPFQILDYGPSLDLCNPYTYPSSANFNSLNIWISLSRLWIMENKTGSVHLWKYSLAHGIEQVLNKHSGVHAWMNNAEITPSMKLPVLMW